MALALRNYLITIFRLCAATVRNSDPDLAKQLAEHVAAEAKHLDQTIGGFLVDKKVKTATTSY